MTAASPSRTRASNQSCQEPTCQQSHGNQDGRHGLLTSTPRAGDLYDGSVLWHVYVGKVVSVHDSGLS